MNFVVVRQNGVALAMQVLTVNAFEKINQLYSVCVEAFVDIDIISSIKLSSTISVVAAKKLYWHGVLIKIKRYPASARKQVLIKLYLSPNIALLDRLRKRKTYISVSILSVLNQILCDELCVKYQFQLSSGNFKKDNFTQFDETDYAFIHRILAQYGLFFYFKFYTDRSELVICDELILDARKNNDITLVKSMWDANVETLQLKSK